jgi:hypothetical protein
MEVHEKINDFVNHVWKFWYKIIAVIKVVIFNCFQCVRIPLQFKSNEN